MRWLLPLALFLVCLMPRTAAADEFMDGNKLLQLCTSTDPGNGFECTGYVMGVADSLAFPVDAEKKPLCIPRGVTVRQIIDVTVTWLQHNVPERSYPAVAAVGIAIARAWKCGD
jgi:hypothetical protein